MPTMNPQEYASEFGGTGAPLRILIADDHALMRQGLRSLLQERPGLIVVGEAANGREAVALALRLQPDVVLMDVIMPSLNGVEATVAIRRRLPETRVLMLSAYTEMEHVVAAVRAGASGYLRKSADIEELELAIRAIARGNTYFSPELLRGLDSMELYRVANEPGSGALDRLSHREREVLQLIGEGFTNREIAEELGVSVKTVEAHISRLSQKLGIRRRGELIRFALRAGVAALDSDSLGRFEARRRAGA